MGLVLFRCVLRDTFDLLMAACNKPFGTLGTGGLGMFNIAEINRGPVRCCQSAEIAFIPFASRTGTDQNCSMPSRRPLQME